MRLARTRPGRLAGSVHDPAAEWTGREARTLLVFRGDVLDEFVYVTFLHKVHGGSAESTAGQWRTMAPTLIASEFNQKIKFPGAVDTSLRVEVPRTHECDYEREIWRGRRNEGRFSNINLCGWRNGSGVLVPKVIALRWTNSALESRRPDPIFARRFG